MQSTLALSLCFKKTYFFETDLCGALISPKRITKRKQVIFLFFWHTKSKTKKCNVKIYTQQKVAYFLCLWFWVVGRKAKRGFMDFNTIFESLMALVRHSSGAVVVYACIVCLLTETVKRLFIPKLKIDLLKKFDPTIIFPFAFGCACSIFHALVVEKTGLSGAFDNVIVNGLTIGATATVVYRMLSSLFGDNLKKLQKDNVFNLFYTEMFVYSDVKSKLLEGKTTMKDFVSEVKLIAEKATAIYAADEPSEQKKQRLVVLMSGLIDDGIIYQVADPIHNALIKSAQVEE